MLSDHGTANHGWEGSLRDGGGQARPGAGALPCQIGSYSAMTGLEMRIKRSTRAPGERAWGVPLLPRRTVTPNWTQDVCGASGVWGGGGRDGL